MLVPGIHFGWIGRYPCIEKAGTQAALKNAQKSDK